MQLTNVSVNYRERARVGSAGVSALTDISLRLGRGEKLGIVGANGAGKSTSLLSLTAGFDPELSGTRPHHEGFTMHLPTDTAMPIQSEFLHEQSRSADAVVASVADNCRFDERAGAERWQRFDELLLATCGDSPLDWDAWLAASRTYVERFCHVASSSVPDAFLNINGNAWLPDVLPQQSVVRLELLNRPLDAMGWNLDDLTSLVNRANVQAHDADAHDAIRIFFETWNQRRDARPSFVAFYDEVREEADGKDWMHALRDRLGLGHLGQTDGSPLPVALMRYPLEAAMRDTLGTAGQTACALPTVLDGGMHEHFFSVPRESAYGATLHLNPDQASVLTAEVVHRRFDYLPEHLWRIGHIQEPRSLRDNALRASRDLHLLELRQGTKRQDFGEPFEGRS